MIAAAFSSVLALTTLVVIDAPRPDSVTVQGQGATKYIAAKTGMTLYVYDGDGVGADCIDDCLKAWPPLLAQAGDKQIGDWKPVSRRSGALQWAYKDMPVYTYANEAVAGQASGDDVGRAWHALQFAPKPPEMAMPPEAQLRHVGGSYVVTNYRGLTLYSFARDGKAPACKGECLEVWPPLRAPILATSIGDWTPVDRPDGIRQWAFQGKLVYSYSVDQAAGDARGADAGGVWKTVNLAGDANSAPPAVAIKTPVAGAAKAGM